VTNLDLAGQLCSVSTPLREARRLHERNFGTFVPHLFMTEVLARVGHCLSPEPGVADRGHRAEVEGILEVLERALGEGERETRNVVSLSFVSDAELEPFFTALRPLLGPLLQRELRGK